MGWLSDFVFGEEYGPSYALGISDPDTHEPLVYRAHAEGKGGDIVPRSDLPEDEVPKDWDARVKNADNLISENIRGPINALARVSQPNFDEMGGSSHIDMIDIENPGFEDVQIVSSGLWAAMHQINSKRISPDGDIDDSYKQESVEIIQQALEDIQQIMDSPEYSDLNAVEQQMREMGFEYAEIQNTVTPSAEEDNTLNPALPQPMPFEFK